MGKNILKIVQKAMIQAKKQGWHLVDFIKFPHPDDSYMIITIVKYFEGTQEKEMFATHIFNESLGENGSFNNGHYEISTLEKAMEDAKGRL